ncbi:MAG TPA: EF2563 family selenium-dependent molybdenum hydroxylase system protein [Candidatus Aphodomonas merdavium]|nr:EF2563 family selenium-dependent molybdenum hydroxylase system protein [Candidatus Aphodomonas merdavium]
MLVVIKGAGDIASGIALRLVRARFAVVMTELPQPTAIRRTVCFSEAVRLGEAEVEGIRAVRACDAFQAKKCLLRGMLPVLADPEALCVRALKPDALVDAILAKRNTGTRRGDAPAVIAVGPGFTAGEDCDAVVETARGHCLGRVYYHGSAKPNDGVPGVINGYTLERVLRAPAAGTLRARREIGELVEAGEAVAEVAGEPLRAAISGMLRGMLPDGTPVTAGMKCGDVDPRGAAASFSLVSDKALAVGGGVLEAVLHLLGGESDGRLKGDGFL